MERRRIERPTPGPWRVGENGADVFGSGTNRDEVIARTWEGLEPRPDQRANSRLIAQAPELVAMVDRLATLLAFTHQDRGSEGLGVVTCRANAAGLEDARALLVRVRP